MSVRHARPSLDERRNMAHNERLFVYGSGTYHSKVRVGYRACPALGDNRDRCCAVATHHERGELNCQLTFFFAEHHHRLPTMAKPYIEPPTVDSTAVFKDDIFKGKVLFCTGGGSGICKAMTQAVVGSLLHCRNTLLRRCF